MAHGNQGLMARNFRGALLGSSALVCAVLNVAGAHAGTLPTGAAVAAGSATIASNGTATTISQSSQNAVINWQSFSVGAGNTVAFNLANAGGATLNRVTGTATSQIAGQITSNGSVYIVNPNGIAITGTGNVQTGSGFVASTLDIADADFMGGRLNFAGTGASKTVTNAGRIAAAQGAYVALLGGSVDNSGTITVPLGRLALGSGEQVALDLNGGNFMQVAVPSAVVADSLVRNSGALSASGGSVTLAAAVVKNAVRNVINMSGSISADSATGNGGTIHLIGGADTANMAGTVTVSGSLSARATGSSGNGGFIETSGEHVSLIGSTVSTSSAHGKAGTWLIDPTDFTVAASGGDETGAALSTALGQGNVLIQSSAGQSSPAITPGGGVNGDININDTVSWSANTLTLDAYRNINVNAVMNATGTAGFAGIVEDTAQSGTGSAIGALLFGLGASGFTGTLNIAPTGSFSLNGANYTIINTLGAAGSTTGTDLQGINGNLSGNYVLGSNIDATATAGWTDSIVSGTGFSPIGYANYGSNGTGFTGAFNGLGHTVSNLSINSPGGYAGLFAETANGSSISGISLANAIVSGSTYVGGLVGLSYSAISNSIVSGTVTANGSNSGGLVGGTFAAISNSAFSGTVTSSSLYVGGLVGYAASGTIITGDTVTGSVSETGNNYAVGGLVGYSIATIINSSSKGGTVSGANDLGGLVGILSGGTITGSSSSDDVISSGVYVGGLVGLGEVNGNTQNFITTSSASGNVVGVANVGGLVGRTNETVSYSTASGNVTGTSELGGLVGFSLNNGILSFDSASGNVTGSLTSGVYIGGLVGESTSEVEYSYATGAASGEHYVGGLAGYVNRAGTQITQSYATGSANGTAYVGGLVGGDANGNISYSYATASAHGSSFVGGLVGLSAGPGDLISDTWASGAVSGQSLAGGLIGFNSGTVRNSYWDSYSTGQGLAIGNSTNPSGVTAVTSDPAQVGAANYAFSAGAYGNLTAAGWVFMGGARPFLASEAAAVVNGVATITNAHQLQLINAGLGGSYVLGGNIDLTQTSAATGTTPNYAGMWGPAGFVPLATDGAGNVWNGTAFAPFPNAGAPGFSGALNGAGFTISNLYMANTGAPFTGLFGVSSGAISNLTLANANVSGGGHVGALAGLAMTGSISNVSVSGVVSGTGNAVGGLAGGVQAGTVSASNSSATVSGLSGTGGLAGYIATTAVLTGDTAIGNVTGTGQTGGFAGYSLGTISTSSASGTVIGTAQTGGFVGNISASASLTSDTASGGVTGTTYTGGFVGYSAGAISGAIAAGAAVTGTSYVGGLVGLQAAGSVGQSTASGAVTASGNYVGGLIGALQTGPVSGSSASGTVSGLAETGGLMGYVATTASLTGDSATGNVTGTSQTGGLVGYAMGALSSSNASGTVIGTTQTGGLVGNMGAGAVLTGDSATGNVTGTSQTGGLAGYSAGTIIGLNGANGTPSISSGNVSGTVDVGGLVGLQAGGSVSLATATSNVTGTGNYVGGLIGSLQAGTVNGSTASGTVSGQNETGGLAGYVAAAASMTSTTAKGSVTGLSQTGGLVGYALGSIASSSSSSAVTGTSQTGGLIGSMGAAASLTGGSATGQVTGTPYTGGLVGYQAGGVVDQSSATGNVTGTNYVGGLIGYQVAGTDTNIYATGNVSGAAATALGGLLGDQQGGSIAEAYAAGTVSGKKPGSLVGVQTGGSVINALWNITITGTTPGVATHSGGTFTASGLATLQLQNPLSGPLNYIGFNFSSIWNLPVTGGYATLKIASTKP